MRHWKPVNHKNSYYRWVLPASAWSRGPSVEDGQLKIVFEDGEWLGAAYICGADDGLKLLSPEEIESIRAEFGLDRYILS